MAARLKLVIAYDGAPFAGWQAQAHGNTVQDVVERAIAKVTGAAVRIHGAGRTDAGVHALGQCAHVDVPGRTLRPAQWIAALNTGLLPEIRVLNCRYVAPTFHARYSAKGKVYAYRLWLGDVLPPFEHGRAWLVRGPFDLEAVRLAARVFEGEHDFARFAANRGTPPADTVRRIDSVKITKRGCLVTMQFEGNGFLYKMVRLMTGLLVRVGQGRATAADVRRQLSQNSVVSQAARYVAPADGLILLRVRY